MNGVKRIFVLSLFIVCLAQTMSFVAVKEKGKEQNKLLIQFNNYVRNDLLLLDTQLYKNEFNQLYSISKFKYYISNIHFKRNNGTEFISGGYFLVNEEEDSSKHVIINDIPYGEYISMNFVVGVDSIHNCSGVQTGSLDPMNGMFWAWNSGYIFLKLEGYSSASTSPDHIFEYHIGGYRQPNNCIRKIDLNFNKEALVVKANKVSSISIKADASQVLKSPTAIDFSKLSSVSDFHHATTIADNYADMFSILKIE